MLRAPAGGIVERSRQRRSPPSPETCGTQTRRSTWTAGIARRQTGAESAETARSRLAPSVPMTTADASRAGFPAGFVPLDPRLLPRSLQPLRRSHRKALQGGSNGFSHDVHPMERTLLSQHMR